MKVKAYMGKPHSYLVGLRDKWAQIEQDSHMEFFQFGDVEEEVDEDEDDDEILEWEE
jgi:hypothetical protein